MANQKLSDIQTERAVLAGIFAYGSNGYYEVCDILTSDTFVDETHQILYKCVEYALRDTKNELIDLAIITSVASSLGYAFLLERPDERKLIRAIFNFPIKQESMRKLAGKLAKLYIARRLHKKNLESNECIQNITGDETVHQIISMVEEPLHEFTNSLLGSNDNTQKIGDGVRAYVDYLASNPVNTVGIPSGYPLHDKSIGGGYRRKTVNLIGARPKIGKTTFGDNVGIYVAGTLGIPVFNADTEMSKEDHRSRILANIAEVPIDDIETGRFGKNDLQKQKLALALDKLESMPYYYESIAGRPFEEIVALMRRWITKTVGHDRNGVTKSCLIIYDYLKLMDASGLDKNMQEYQLLGFQISALHNFTVKYDVPCLAFIQLNRDGITKEDTDVASGSDRQIWLCSNFSIFKKKSDEEIAEDSTSNRKLVPIIARHGGGLDDGDYINMKFVGKFNKIIEGKTRNDSRKTGGFQVENNTDPIPFQ